MASYVSFTFIILLHSSICVKENNAPDGDRTHVDGALEAPANPLSYGSVLESFGDFRPYYALWHSMRPLHSQRSSGVEYPHALSHHHTCWQSELSGSQSRHVEHQVTSPSMALCQSQSRRSFPDSTRNPLGMARSLRVRFKVRMRLVSLLFQGGLSEDETSSQGSSFTSMPGLAQ